MRATCAAVVAAVLAGVLAAPASAAEPELTSEDDKILYAIGYAVSRQVTDQGFSAEERERILAGMRDNLEGSPLRIDINTYGPKINAFMQARVAARGEAEKDASQAFLSEAAGLKGAEKTGSGLVYVETQTGSGDAPAATARVEVHYHGTLRDGSVFDSSVDRGKTATFPLDGVIPCWTEGLQKMRVGGKASLYCPADIAYGDRGSGKIPPGAALRFDVELVSIQ